jgi:NADH:ubiquinone oxidoreductase subunit 5 (subunit L)/multisubunit Na+/H+ antiporter MnhA subunit
MEWYEVGLLILAIVLVIAVVLLGFQILRRKKFNEKIDGVINEHFSDVEITKYNTHKLYQIEFKKEKKYLIKLIDMKPQSEIIITNSEKVVVNHDIKGWKRSTKPNFVPGMTEFINLKSDTELVKIVLIYPNCHNILKYINESDAYVVDMFKQVDGIFYVKFDDFDEFLKKQ